MALTAGYSPNRRGQPPTAGEFGYPVAPGEQIWRGGMVGINSSGYMQRLQTSGTLAFLGLASMDFNNTASSAPGTSPGPTALKGTWALTVPGATVANINAPVFATDDNTFTLSNAEAAVFALGGSDTGTRVPASITVAAGAKVGVYNGVVLSGAATASLTDPNGDALGTITFGTAYSSGGLSFTYPNSGGTAPIAGDTFTITVSESAGALQVGTLAGIDNGQTFVRLLGS